MNGWKRIASFRWRERRPSGISMGGADARCEAMLHEPDVRNFPCARDKSPAAELIFMAAESRFSRKKAVWVSGSGENWRKR